MKCKLSDFIEINPKEALSKNALAKKVAMEKLDSYCREISGYEIEAYTGGSKFRNKDTLMARITPCLENGKIAQVNILDKNEVGFGSTEFIVLRAKKDIADPDYIYYLTISELVRIPAIKSMVGSSGRQRVQTDVVENLEIDLPDLRTQKKIAKILSALDDKIECNNQINKNLEEQAQALFKSWFIDFEPYGGKIPNDWMRYKLSDFLPVITGKKNANISSKTGKYPFFSCSQDIAWTENYSFEGDAILVAGNGDFNVKFYNGKFEAYQRTYVLIPYNSKYTSWLYYVVKYNLSEITSAARGSVIKFITKGNLEEFTFFAPKNLQNFDLVDTFGVINNIISTNIQENYKLCNIRDTLLPKLMSGELDVSDIDI